MCLDYFFNLRTGQFAPQGIKHALHPIDFCLR